MGERSTLSPTKVKKLQRKRQRERSRERERELRHALMQARDALAALDRATRGMACDEALALARERAADAVLAIEPLIN